MTLTADLSPETEALMRQYDQVAEKYKAAVIQSDPPAQASLRVRMKTLDMALKSFDMALAEL